MRNTKSLSLSLTKRAFTLCILSVLTATTPKAVAQELSSTKQTQTTSPMVQQVEIRSKGHKYDPRREDTVTKFVITREEIEKYGDTSVADILKRQPGMANGQINGLRGYTQYLIDGQPPPRNFRLEDLQLEQIERIEIIRSAVAELSTQSIGGSINFILKRQIKAASRKIQFRLMHQDESKVAKQLSLNLDEKFDDFSYGISVIISKNFFGRTRVTSIENADANLGKQLAQTLRTNTDNSNLAYLFNPSIHWKLTDNDTLAFKVRMTELKGETKELGTRELFDASTPHVQSEYGEGIWEPSIRFLEGSWEKQLSERAKLSNILSVYQMTTNAKNQTAIITPRSIQSSDVNIFETRKKLVWSGDLSYGQNEKQSFKSGWHFDSEDSSSLESDSNATKLPSKIRTKTMAFFSQKEWTEDDAWSHYLGARWESFHAATSDVHGTRLGKTRTVLSPIAQTRWKNPENKENQIRFAIARTFKNPEASQMITTTLPHLNNDLTLPDTIGNPQLKPEIAWGLDSAFEHFGENEFNYSVSHYLKKVNDLLRDRLFQDQGRWLQQTINDGDALSHGFVFDMSLPLSLIIKDAKKLNVKANMSRNWSTVNNVAGPNNRFAEQAKFNANFSVDYKLNDAWKMGATYGIVSGGPLRLAPDRINLIQVRRSSTAYVNWIVNKEVNLRIFASNLLVQPVYSQSTIFAQGETMTTRTQSRGVMFSSISVELKF
jgi:outer membrane receptor for ferrienterochelin and colicins